MSDSRRSSTTSCKSFTSGERRQSIESLKKASLESLKRSSLPNQKQESTVQPPPSNQNEGVSDAYAQSKFSRKRSVQYRNTGWKSSRERFNRNDSSSSIRSNQSDKILNASAQLQEEVTAPSPISAENQKHYFEQKFIDIALMLRDAGVDEEIVQMIQA